MSNKKTALEKVGDDEEVFALRGQDLSAPRKRLLTLLLEERGEL